MKKLLMILTVITLSLTICRSSFAAIAATIAWEVRTTGASTNGGGFKTGASGTDYSQQDAAQISRTDLVIGNPTTTTLTSVATPFTTAEIGNLIQITAGTNFTTGFYEITAVNGSNIATVDRSVGTAGSTGGTGAVGGAIDHPNTISTSVVANNTIYIQNGTYNEVGANTYVLTASVAGGNGTPITWIGYITNRSTIPTGTDRPLFDGTGVTNSLVVSGATNIFKNIRFASATGDVVTISKHFYCINCKISNGGDNGIDSTANADIFLINIELNNNAGKGIGTNYIPYFVLRGSYIHDNTSNGIISAGSSYYSFYENNIFDSNSATGLQLKGNVSAIGNNIFYNNTGASSDGVVDVGIWSGLIPYYNNSSINNGRYGFSRSGTTVGQVLFDYNNYNSNGTAGLNNITAGANDNTTAPTFTDAANGDFTITSADAALLGLGFMQSATNGLTGDYQWNIGVDQDDNTAASTGGGASFFSMN